MTREEAIKHPDYVYVPMLEERDHPQRTVEHLLKHNLELFERYAQHKYQKPLEEVMRDQRAKIIVSYLDGREAGLNDVVYFELTNHEWFEKEVMNDT